MSINELIYLAGYFDGEGCVCFLNKPDRKYANLSVSVTSGDFEVVRAFYRIFGGYFKPLGTSQCKNRVMHCWRRYGANAQETLHQLLPYLRAKKEVAQLALTVHFDTPKGQPLSDAEIQLRESASRQVRAINNRVESQSSTLSTSEFTA